MRRTRLVVKPSAESLLLRHEHAQLSIATSRPLGTSHTTICYNMGRHMKTTVEISDALLDEARRVAGREKTTLRSLVEQGLRRVLQERRAHAAFRLKKASFKGRGFQPAMGDPGSARI